MQIHLLLFLFDCIRNKGRLLLTSISINANNKVFFSSLCLVAVEVVPPLKEGEINVDTKEIGKKNV